jgi:hypothetical protein
MPTAFELSSAQHIWLSICFKLDAQVRLDSDGLAFLANILATHGATQLVWFVYHCLETRIWIWDVKIWTIPYRIKLHFCNNALCTLPLRALNVRWEHFCENMPYMDVYLGKQMFSNFKIIHYI